MKTPELMQIPALIVNQWLSEWDRVHFSDIDHRRKPAPYFFLFTLPAIQLRKLSRVYQRKANKPRALDMSIQRNLEETRVEELGKFLHGGYPWSELSEIQKKSEDYLDLRMPGWLPTAIVANILPPGAKRDGEVLRPEDAISIEFVNQSLAKIILPAKSMEDGWSPNVPPFEIIDGQHRLGSFDDIERLDGDFELPIVAFSNLDFTWQAYLFYTINIKPKKINMSLAYDLYPLLRIQDWLEKAQSGPIIYRETRAQELTEILWAHPESPWRNRINMLGEKKGGDVTQAAFIRSLLSSYVKRGKPIGGLFGDELHNKRGDLLQWNRISQGAFLILIWQILEHTFSELDEPWMQDLRKKEKQGVLIEEEKKDPTFSGPYTLLATDQGVRGILQVTNDMCFVAADQLKLNEWIPPKKSEDDTDYEAITKAIKSLRKEMVSDFLSKMYLTLAKFDWRVSSTPYLPDEKRRNQMVYKGSSGYKEMRLQLIRLLCNSGDEEIAKIANRIRGVLKY